MRDFEKDKEIGRSVAEEIKIKPKSMEYIEARGFLCYELRCLLEGRIEFVLIPWWNVLKRIGDFIWGVFPICRWFPPEHSTLELVGYHSQFETKVFRFSNKNNESVIFFIEYTPESPGGFSGFFFPFNLPKLKEDNFIRPPFDSDKKLIE